MRRRSSRGHEDCHRSLTKNQVKTRHITARPMLESQSPETTQPPVFQPRYKTIAPIGRGGMAEVFLAVMTSAGGVSKLAVLKQIWPELASDPHFVAMFLDEARLSVRMSHPNLVQTYEVIDDRSRLAIAIEDLDGQPLAPA